MPKKLALVAHKHLNTAMDHVSLKVVPNIRRMDVKIAKVASFQKEKALH